MDLVMVCTALVTVVVTVVMSFSKGNTVGRGSRNLPVLPVGQISTTSWIMITSIPMYSPH